MYRTAWADMYCLAVTGGGGGCLPDFETEANRGSRSIFESVSFLGFGLLQGEFSLLAETVHIASQYACIIFCL